MIRLDEFDLKQDYFDHKSWLHGIQHTYRVMAHVCVLGNLAGYTHETRLAFFSAFIHDMARKNDHVCSRHGTWAAEKKLPQFLPLFDKYGISTTDKTAIETAVRFHSLSDELRPGHPHYVVTALLKDADALDRYRMGDDNLDVSYLRLPEAINLLSYSRELFYKSEELQPASVAGMMALAAGISGLPAYLS